MPEVPVFQSALAHVAPHMSEGFLMEPAPEMQRFLLRGPAGDAFCAAVAATLGVRPPVAPNTAVDTGKVSVLWLGPEEWLVEAAEIGPDDLAEALAGLHSTVVDIGHAHAVIRLSGARVPDILASGCSVDLHPRVFPGVARTLVGKADVILRRHERVGPPAFDLHVGRSYADYLWRWLLAAVSA